MSKRESQKPGGKQPIKKDPSRSNLQAQPESEQVRHVREKRERQTLQSVIRENVHTYLKNLEPHEGGDLIAGRVVQSSTNEVEENVKLGLIDIPTNPLPLQQIVKFAQKLGAEELKEHELKHRREELQRKMDYLSEQIRGQNAKNRENGKEGKEIKQVLTKEQHEQKMREILAEKEERKRRMEEVAEEEERRRKEVEERDQGVKASEIQRLREKKRKEIENNVKRKKSEHQKFLRMERQLQKEFVSVKEKERLYQKMENQYQSQVMLPYLEQKKIKLKHLREFHKNFDLQSIRKHEKKYLLLQEQRLRERNDHSEEKKEMYQPPPRSERLTRLLEQDELEVKQKLEEKRNKNQEMQQRLQSFGKELKAKHRPKVDQEKKQQILQRYVEEQRKHERASIDGRKLGENYMQIAKRMRRSESHRGEVKTEKEGKSERADQGQLQLSRAYNRSQDFYEGVRRKKMEGIVNSEESSPNQKYHLLRLEAEKLGERIRQKEELARVGGDETAHQETADLLVSAIKAKMGIMNVLKQQGRGFESVHIGK